jgi:hypothetical protein
MTNVNVALHCDPINRYNLPHMCACVTIASQNLDFYQFLTLFFVMQFEI